MVVPCGHCPFCSATRRSDWALRLHYEAKLHDHKSFVTLTYADPHLTWKNSKPQLVKRDLQLFFKRLRKNLRGEKIRYYAVGEYGSKTLRPHYHVLLFGNCDEKVIRMSWPYGQVHIGHVNDASVMYCLGYIVDSRNVLCHRGRERPFATMSRRPGLGINYLTSAMIEWHKSDRKNYAVLHGRKRHLPRYYKEKIFSKIDLVRIAVRDQKEHFKKMVSWLRSPAMQRQRDPLAYRAQQMRIAARKIRSKTKSTHII